MASRISQDDYKRALARGRQALAKPHVVSARFIACTHVLELAYSNVQVLRIDPEEVPALKGLSRQVLAQAYVTPGGDGLVFGEGDTAAVSLATPTQTARWSTAAGPRPALHPPAGYL